MPTALIVDDDMDNLLTLAEVFRTHGYQAEMAQDLERARDILLGKMPDIALLEEKVGDDDVLDVLEQLDLAHVAP